MERRYTNTTDRPANTTPLESFDSDSELTDKRLDSLLRANAEFAEEKNLYRTENEDFEEKLLESPLTTEQAFSRFGLLLGAFPPAAIFGKFLFESFDGNPNAEYWVIPLLLFVNFVTAATGFYSGKLVGKAMKEIEKLPWWSMILILPFVGLFWGILSGGAGGIIIFLVGAIFGAIIGGMVGSVGLSAFGILHRIFKRGDHISQDQFLPIAFGVTFAICAIILGAG